MKDIVLKAETLLAFTILTVLKKNFLPWRLGGKNKITLWLSAKWFNWLID
ncbi:hypothetical protein [Flavobacterium limnophilum]|nr:hypothetical protein [Flavobacterium limnophilum]